MTNEATEQGQDVFDDSDPGESGAATETLAPASEAAAGAGKTTDKDGQANDGAEGEEDEGQTGDDAGTPPAGQEGDPEFVTDAKGQKMIPEHRFKAALKAVTDERDDIKNKYEEVTKAPVPDKDTDPEGHDLHIRMEASKAVMMEMRDDYQEVINHYGEMAKDNPLLNEAVSKHPLPAKLAYDIAKKDLEIKDALKLKDSDEFKEFQEWKKTKAAEAASKTTEEKNLNNTVQRGLKAVPNLNRSTNASPNRNVRRASSSDADDDLFKGAL